MSTPTQRGLYLSRKREAREAQAEVEQLRQEAASRQQAWVAAVAECASLRQRLEEEKERYAHLLRLKTPRYVCADHNGKVPHDGACIMCQLEQAQKERDCVKFELQAKEATRLKDNEYLLSRVSQAEAALAELQKLIDKLKRGENCWCEVGIGNPMMRGEHSKVCWELQRRRSPRAE